MILNANSFEDIYFWNKKHIFCRHLETTYQKDSNNNISNKETLRMWDTLLNIFSKKYLKLITQLLH